MHIERIRHKVDAGNSLGKQRATVELNETISHVLSRDLYSKPIESMMREILINAIDAHMESGQKQPVEIELPHIWGEQFSIRDYGHGIPHDQLMGIYLAYGESTRRDSNLPHGGLGLGTKSPLAYVSSFVVSSYVDGTLREYLVYYDEDNIPCVDHRSTTSTDEPNGIRVALTTVHSNDYRAFKEAAIRLLKYIPKKLWTVTNAGDALIDVEQLKLQQIRDLDSLILRPGTGAGLVMGYVMYDVDRDALISYYDNKGTSIEVNGVPVAASVVFKQLSDKSFVEFQGSIGDLLPHPSRERINITPRTAKYLASKLQEAASKLFKDKDLDLPSDTLRYELTSLFPAEKYKIRVRYAHNNTPSWSYYHHHTTPRQLNTYDDLILQHIHKQEQVTLVLLSSNDMTDYLGNGRSSYEFPKEYPQGHSLLFVDKDYTNKEVVAMLERLFPTADFSDKVEEYRKEREAAVNNWAPSPRYHRPRTVVKSFSEPEHNVLVLKAGAFGYRKVDWESAKHNAKTLQALGKKIYWVPTKMGVVSEQQYRKKMRYYTEELAPFLPKWKTPVIIGLPKSKGTKTIEATFECIDEIEKMAAEYFQSDYWKRRELIRGLGEIANRVTSWHTQHFRPYGNADWLYRMQELYHNRCWYRSESHIIDTTIPLDTVMEAALNNIISDVATKFPMAVIRYPTLEDACYTEWAKQVAEMTGNKPTGAKSK